MKKVLLIMAAALMTMTQCRKQETSPVTPSANTIKMTVTAGSGAKTNINTETGAITWSAGDKLWVSDGASWLGSLTLVGEGGSAQGTFTGSIAGIGEGGTTCHFFYLGHDNGMEEPAGTAAASISFVAQDGTLDGAMKYHIGYGRTDVTVESGEYQGYVLMNTKIAIAHLNLTEGTSAYTKSVTMDGTGVSNTLSVNPDGTFSGGGDGGITIGNGNGTTGERYVTLIPTTGTDRVDVAFTGDATGSMTFLAGISENKFYGMKDAMTVTLESSVPKFSVDENTTVEFAPGNLYWDGSVFKFVENQWSYGSYFFWSKTASVACAQSYNDSDVSNSDVFFTNATQTTANPDFQVSGETAGTWRTLSDAEWGYLLRSRDDAEGLCAWKELDGGTYKGVVILPDGTDASVMSSITSKDDLASSGAVFLPAAGHNFDGMQGVGNMGFYWLSSLGGEQSGYSSLIIFFMTDYVDQAGDFRSNGDQVRLVR